MQTTDSNSVQKNKSARTLAHAMFKPCQLFFLHSMLVVALLILSATPAPVRRSIDNDYNLRLVNQSRNLSEIEVLFITRQ